MTAIRLPKRARADESFASFYAAELPRLVSIALALTGDRELAADLAQESLARGFARWDRVATMDNPGAWVRRVVVNLCVDAHRRRTREHRTVDKIGRLPTDATDVAVGELWTLVRRLPNRQRAAIVLFYVDDLSTADIARALDVTPGTVTRTLVDARRSLAATLGLAEEE